MIGYRAMVTGFTWPMIFADFHLDLWMAARTVLEETIAEFSPRVRSSRKVIVANFNEFDNLKA